MAARYVPQPEQLWGIYDDTGNLALGAAFNVLVPRDESNAPAGPIGGPTPGA